MKTNPLQISSVFDYKNFDRVFCKHKVKDNNSKCRLFYQRLQKNDKIELNRIVCPYGYTVLLFGQQIVTSLIDSESDIGRFIKRDRYNSKLSKTDYSNEDYSIISNSSVDNLVNYNLLSINYKKYSPLFHDISNSISSCLEFFRSSFFIIEEDLVNGYTKINNKLINLKSYKTKYLNFYRPETKYNEINEEFLDDLKDFELTVKKLYELSEEYVDLQDEELTIIAGYGLFSTLIDYYKRLYGDFKVDNSPHYHKPHQMLKKLSRMLSNKAKKRNIKLIFTSRSHDSKNKINNISDIYIAFFSILENAIKHSKNNSEVLIDIQDIDSESTVTITNISNDIYEDELPRLIDFGYKGKNSQNNPDSSGYGMYLINQIFTQAKVKYKYIFKDNSFVFEVSLTDL